MVGRVSRLEEEEEELRTRKDLFWRQNLDARGVGVDVGVAQRLTAQAMIRNCK